MKTLYRFFASAHGLRALQHPTYFLFWTTQFLVLVGVWMMDTARSWLVYELTGDPRKLGLVVFASNAPILIMGLFSGTIVDKCNRQRALSMTQMSLGLIACVLFVLSACLDANGVPLIRYWHLLVLAFFAGIINMIDMPVRQSILVQMVPRNDLPNALALNSMMFNITRIIGPSIAGVILAKVGCMLMGFSVSGVSLCFLFNGIAFLITSFITTRLHLEVQISSPPMHGALHHLKEGLNYCVASPHIGVVTFYTGIIALFALPYLTVLPVFAKDVFMGGPAELGRLMASVGVGAIAGGIMMTCINTIPTVMRLVAIASVCFAITMAVFAHCPSIMWADIAILFGGLFMSIIMVGCQTVVQTLVSERFRGRVNVFYTVTAVGFMPLGSLAIGFLVHEFGPRNALTINSVCIFIAALCYNYFRPKLLKKAKQTPEYRQMMHVPEI